MIRSAIHRWRQKRAWAKLMLETDRHEERARSIQSFLEVADLTLLDPRELRSALRQTWISWKLLSNPSMSLTTVQLVTNELLEKSRGTFQLTIEGIIGGEPENPKIFIEHLLCLIEREQTDEGTTMFNVWLICALYNYLSLSQRLRLWNAGTLQAQMDNTPYIVRAMAKNQEGNEEVLYRMIQGLLPGKEGEAFYVGVVEDAFRHFPDFMAREDVFKRFLPHLEGIRPQVFSGGGFGGLSTAQKREVARRLMREEFKGWAVDYLEGLEEEEKCVIVDVELLLPLLKDGDRNYRLQAENLLKYVKNKNKDIKWACK